jgi:regulator of RNase E activity RraB
MTTKEGEKYTQRADETRLLIDELMEKKEPTEVFYGIERYFLLIFCKISKN